jgi:hypothetical protein
MPELMDFDGYRGLLTCAPQLGPEELWQPVLKIFFQTLCVKRDIRHRVYDDNKIKYKYW